MALVRRAITVIFQLADGTHSSVSGLRVQCVISNAGPPSQGQAEVAIFGMTLSDMNKYSTIGTQIDQIGKNFIGIQAGDAQSGMPTVFTGTITQAYVDAKGMPEVCFRVSSVAGQYGNVASAAATSVSGSADVATMAKTMAQKMGFMFEGNNVQAKLKNPYYFGTGLSQLKQLASDANIGWTIENNKVAIWTNGQPRDGDAINISPQTGMVGYPAFSGASITVTTLFNSQLRQAQKINVTSDLTPACGAWNVINLVHEIESEIPHGKWFSHLEATRIGSQDPPYAAPQASNADGSSAGAAAGTAEGTAQAGGAPVSSDDQGSVEYAPSPGQTGGSTPGGSSFTSTPGVDGGGAPDVSPPGDEVINLPEVTVEKK